LTENILFIKKLKLRVILLAAKLKELIQFFKDSREELKKVTWPDREEVTSYTVVVVIALIIFSIFLWLVDTGLMALVRVALK